MTSPAPAYHFCRQPVRGVDVTGINTWCREGHLGVRPALAKSGQLIIRQHRQSARPHESRCPQRLVYDVVNPQSTALARSSVTCSSWVSPPHGAQSPWRAVDDRRKAPRTVG